MASAVVYQKQIDGSYYVVQAVPDTKKRTTYIVSAYMQKNEGPRFPVASSDASGAHMAQSSMTPRATQQAPDVQAPGHTSENALANAASSQFASGQRSVQNDLAPLASHETVSESINQLLDNRLQLPELVADDTFVAYSIRQNAENGNRTAENIQSKKEDT